MGTISIEHGNRLFWLGRYTERVFTTLKSLEKLYDKMLDDDPKAYISYLSCLGLQDVYEDQIDFFIRFVFDKENQSSVAAALQCAYDNGIVLREEISTESLSFLQMAMDLLDKTEKMPRAKLRLSLLRLRDILYGFWGCLWDYVIDDELAAIIGYGKYAERFDLYMRLKYPEEDKQREFTRMCSYLAKIPKNTPYRYNTQSLSVLVEFMGGDNRRTEIDVLSALGKLFAH